MALRPLFGKIKSLLNSAKEAHSKTIAKQKEQEHQAIKPDIAWGPTVPQGDSHYEGKDVSMKGGTVFSGMAPDLGLKESMSERGRPNDLRSTTEHEAAHSNWHNNLTPEDQIAFKKSLLDLETAKKTGSKTLSKDSDNTLYQYADNASSAPWENYGQKYYPSIHNEKMIVSRYPLWRQAANEAANKENPNGVEIVKDMRITGAKDKLKNLLGLRTPLRDDNISEAYGTLAERFARNREDNPFKSFYRDMYKDELEKPPTSIPTMSPGPYKNPYDWE